MKFVLFNVKDNIDKVKIEKHNIDEDKYLVEINLSKKLLDKRLDNKKGFLKNLKNEYIDKKLHKEILKAIDNIDTKWYYALSMEISKNIDYTKYVEILSNSILGYKYIVSDEMVVNAIKHIKKHEVELKNTKVLLVYKEERINLTLIQNLISEIKTVNIYAENASKYFQKQIARINKTEGTTIEIIKGGKKAFTEYNVVYFVDAIKQDYPRFRINKKALVIDKEYEDEFNSNIVFLDSFMKTYKDTKKIEELINNYGKCIIATYINKVKSAY